jgi:hypothetical protein
MTYRQMRTFFVVPAVIRECEPRLVVDGEAVRSDTSELEINNSANGEGRVVTLYQPGP